MGHFYPRPPRGGRHNVAKMETDFDEFLSTPSARRATMFLDEFDHIIKISIHALREEGDRKVLLTMRQLFEISIHALREEGDHDCRI